MFEAISYAPISVIHYRCLLAGVDALPVLSGSKFIEVDYSTELSHLRSQLPARPGLETLPARLTMIPLALLPSPVVSRPE